jgi:uncharacterized damage-inducible protein DinB
MSEYNFKLLAKYNKTTNELMNNIIRDLSEEEWNRNFPTFFKSIHELCSHIYVSDIKCLKRFKGLRDFDIHSRNIIKKDYDFSEIFFSNINEYIILRTELDNIIIEFVNGIKDSDFGKTLKFTDSKDNSIERKMEVLLIHVFNHETHHRGMISLLLEMLGKENDYSGIYQKEL